jgi:hypothetical protein
VVLPAAHSLFLLRGRDAAYEILYEVLIGERECAVSFVESQMNELKDSKVLARIEFETGIGFVPFGGTGYEVFKRIS